MTIELGIKLPDHADIAEFARRVESMGVDYVFQGEHLFFHGPVSNSLVDLSFAAAATSRLKVLSSATLVPLYPPVLLAKMAASVAVNSKGRFNLGVGVGGDFPAEFAACGVPTATRGRATDAALEVMTQLWRGEPLGPFSTSDGELDVVLDPLPLGGSIPLWICGRSPATITRAARIGDWWMPYLYSLDRFRRDHARLEEQANALGRPCPRAALHAFAVLGDSRRSAVEYATSMLGSTYSQSFDASMVERLCIAGASGECAEQILAFVESGANAVCLNLFAEEHEYDRRLEQLCSEVLPQLRTSAAAPSEAP